VEHHHGRTKDADQRDLPHLGRRDSQCGLPLRCRTENRRQVGDRSDRRAGIDSHRSRRQHRPQPEHGRESSLPIPSRLGRASRGTRWSSGTLVSLNIAASPHSTRSMPDRGAQRIDIARSPSVVARVFSRRILSLLQVGRSRRKCYTGYMRRRGEPNCLCCGKAYKSFPLELDSRPQNLDPQEVKLGRVW
jgi:hypothetical protein